MVAKSSVNENKAFAFNLSEPGESGRNQVKAWKCGRGEVAW